MNGPLLLAFISLINWTCAALFMAGYRVSEGYGLESLTSALHEAARIMVGIEAAGVAAAALIFFYLDVLFKKIRPLFFPDGGLLQEPGAFRLKISTRLLLAFLIISVIPMLGLTFLFGYKIVSTLAVNPEEAKESIYNAAVFLPLALIVPSIMLSRVVADGVADPIRNIETAMARVREGDLSATAPVSDNDELGHLAESFNHMIQGLKERRRIRESLELAREVQQSLLPRTPPQCPGLDLAGRSEYSEQTGGDYFDYFQGAGAEACRVGLVTGDVSEHGLQAAFLMTTVRALLRQRAEASGKAGQIITDVNQALVRDVNESGRFVSLLYIDIDALSRTAACVRAGHGRALVYDRHEDIFTEMSGDGPALGTVSGYEYLEADHALAPGQIIILPTDGFWQTRNPDGLQYEPEAMKKVIRSMAEAPAAGILAAVFDDFFNFIRPNKLEDDVTMVVVKVGNLGQPG